MRSLCFLVLIGALTEFSSCRNKTPETAYAEVFRQADSMDEKGSGRPAIRLIDSFFRGQPDPPPYWQFRRYRFIQVFYINAELFDTSDLYIDSMLYALEHSKATSQYPEAYGIALNDKGDYYYLRDNLSKAFEYYYRSQLAAREGNDTCGFGFHDYHLGMVTYRQGKYSESLQYFLRALRENRYCVASTLRFYKDAELFNNIALAYDKTGRSDSAAFFYAGGLDIIDEYEREHGVLPDHFGEKARGVIYGNLARIFIRRGETDTAEILLKKSIEINTRPGNEIIDGRLAQAELAKLYLEQGRSPLPLLDAIRRSLDTLPDAEAETRWSALMYQYHRSKGAFGEAANQMSLYIQLKDSLAENSSVHQTDVNQLLRYSEAQAQVSLLRKDNELRRLYLWGAIGFSVMPFVIVVLIYVNYRRSKRNILILTDLNGQINEQNTTLESALTALEFSNKDKDRIMRVVAHDLRGPISGVAVLADRLLHKEEMEEGERKSLSLIRDTSYSSMSLINELLEHNSPADEEREAADIGDLVRESVQVLSGRAAEKGQELRVNEGAALSVYVNKGRIARVLTNIITNAIKFSPERGLIRIGISREGALAVVAVRDEGIGIPEDLKTHVFGTVSRAKRRGTAGEQSYGLGLSISRQIVEQNKGKLWFESEEGKGSTFYIALPLSTVTEI